MSRKPITLQGKIFLEAELKHLVEEERIKIIAAIKVAREHGDLSENADYAAAKERQGHIEGRIASIGETLANAEVVDTSKIKADRITFGAYVDLEDDEGKKVSYQIVGEDESDVNQGKISIRSPLARSLIGKKKGEKSELHTARGEKIYQILKFYFK